MKRLLCFLLSLLLLLVPAGGFTVAASTLTQPVVAGVSVHLGEDFTVRFYIRVPEGGENVRASVGGVTYPAVPAEEEGVYVVTYPHISLLDMTAEITVIPSCRMNNAVLKGVAYDFSMRDYAMRVLAKEEAGTPLRRVLVAMLNYGAAAQVYNSHRIVNLPNSYLTTADLAIVPRQYESVLRMTGEDPEGTLAALTSASMVITDTACFKFYLNVEGQEMLRTNGGSGFPEWQTLTQAKEAAKLVENIFVEIADNPAFEDASSFPLEKVAEMEGYRSVSTGIYASEFGRTYYIRVRTPAGVGRVLEYSVETYVARNLNAELDDSARRMVIAMMEYGDAVSAYRASLLD